MVGRYIWAAAAVAEGYDGMVESDRRYCAFHTSCQHSKILQFLVSVLPSSLRQKEQITMAEPQNPINNLKIKLEQEDVTTDNGKKEIFYPYRDH